MQKGVRGRLIRAICGVIEGQGAFLAVAAVAAVALGIGISAAKLTTPFSDPFGPIRAQDEAVYASSSIDMANSGHWITPRFLGRFLLYKPPLPIWLSAASVKLLGPGEGALRLPALLASVLATVVLFAWCRCARSPAAGIAVVLILLSNPLWHTFARLCYTDMLWACCTTCALACIFFDPRLERTRTILLFGLTAGLSIMVKNVAGLLPLVVVSLQNVLAPRESRTPVRALAKSAGIMFVVVAPWHLYQAVRHTQWFWMDYVQIQLLGFGLAPPVEGSQEMPLLFYLKRLVLLDPVLAVIALAGLVVCVHHALRRERVACLLIVWAGVGLLMLSVFQYRNLPYVLMLIPPLALSAAIYGVPRRYAVVVVPFLAVVFVVKAASQDSVWGLKWGHPEPLPAIAAVDEYAQLRRPNDLVLTGTADEFYAATVGLPKVRYYFVDTADVVRKYAPHYVELGITLMVDEVERLDELEPRYARTLQAWGLASTDPIGSALVSRTPDGLQRILTARPEWDALVREEDLALLSRVLGRTHEARPVANGYVAVVSRAPTQSALRSRPSAVP